MITVIIGEEKVVLVPRALQDYIHKVDYIKTRRPSPYAALEGVPSEMTAVGKSVMAEGAMKAYMQLSSVSFDEELAFDCSFEGFFYSLWQAAKASIQGWKDLKPSAGIVKAKDWYNGLEPEKAEEVSLALRGIDQRTLAKNSDGPQENPT